MWQVIGSALGTLSVLIGAAIKFGGKSSRMRGRVLRDIDLYAKLPAESGARAPLLDHIGSTVDRFIAIEQTNDERKTDWAGIAVVILLVLIGTPIAIYVLRAEPPIYLAIAGWGAVGFCVLFSVVGLMVSVRKGPEDS